MKFSNTVTGIFWMVITGLLFVSVTAVVKFLGTSMPSSQAAFLRYVLGMVLLVPLFPKLIRISFSYGILKIFVVRGFLHAFGVLFWFYAMARIPLADVTAINYLSPIFVTIGAAIFLKENMSFRRIIAIGIAFIGALIILRPGFQSIDIGHIAMLAASLVFAGSYLLAKRASLLASPAIVVAMLSIIVPIVLAPFAYLDWVPPSNKELLILFLVAVLATSGHYTMTLALREAPITITQPVTFLQLVWAVLLGYFIFSEAMDIWVVFGAIIIILSTTFINWRELYLHRKILTPPNTAAKV